MYETPHAHAGGARIGTARANGRSVASRVARHASTDGGSRARDRGVVRADVCRARGREGASLGAWGDVDRNRRWGPRATRDDGDAGGDDGGGGGGGDAGGRGGGGGDVWIARIAKSGRFRTVGARDGGKVRIHGAGAQEGAAERGERARVGRYIGRGVSSGGRGGGV